ncbi:MAG: EamA family transporter RarD [Nevskiaceae bacterium]|nr:MAG: EamA family transporter RarD [Nevskiaceae bacterium]
MNNGLWAAAGAYFIWGLFPLYWRLLAQVPSTQIMAHRIVWCALFVSGYLTLSQGARWWRTVAAQPRLLAMLTCSAVLVGINWWLYIWAVNSGHIVETSLGYFINPLVSVLLGVAVLRERLTPGQWLAVAVAAAGVAYLTWSFGALPWIALVLAASFGTYGLIRKLAVVAAVPGLAVESGVLFLPALGYLLWAEHAGSGSFGHIEVGRSLLLMLGGLVTALPLVLFAYGARRIPLSLIGFLQYLAPTLQLLIGVYVFGEAFTHTHLVGFGCIWAALAIYALDSLLRARLRPATAAS